MVLMPVASMSPGANNLVRRFTQKTSMQGVFDARCPRRAESENQSGVQPRTAHEVLRIPPDANLQSPIDVRRVKRSALNWINLFAGRLD
jgi:hypothetical protein